MNRDELVTAISETSGLPKASVSKCLNALVEVVKTAVGNGSKVTLVGFELGTVHGVKQRRT